jgi:catechol 2,3-dioxygenase-like lactoylglutathione lyase family enzyme
MSHLDEGQRPEIAIGHVKLLVGNVSATTDFFVALGIRPIVTKEDFAVLELRGGTHLVLRPAEGPVEQGAKVPFDVMVDDIEAAASRYRQRGLEVGSIRRGRIHDSFDVLTPDRRHLEVNSSHAGQRPV